jgi:hypothetical protein
MHTPPTHTLQGESGSTNMTSLLTWVNVTMEGCAKGYTGTACRDCTRPGYYRLGKLCVACPKTAYTAIFLFSLALGTGCWCAALQGASHRRLRLPMDGCSVLSSAAPCHPLVSRSHILQLPSLACWWPPVASGST